MNYLNLNLPVKTRMQILRNKNPDWRKARELKLTNYASATCALDQGFNGKKPIGYCHTGVQFRNEKYADEINSRIRHTGWFTDTDTDQGGTVRGIVASLSHGRFIAGYQWSDNGERVYFDEVFTNDSDAANMADEQARVNAESQRECAEKFDAAQKLEIDIEDAFARLRECIALRNVASMSYVREEIAEIVDSIKSMRDTLKNDYAGVI